MYETEIWNFQWSIKSPAGGMLNIRTQRADEMALALESISALIPAMLAVEQTMMGAGNVAAQMPLAQPAQQNAAQQAYQQPQQQFQPQQAQAPQYAQVPNAGAAPGPAPLCMHNQPAKWVKPGISKSSGNPYRGFWACNAGREQDCGFKS